MNDIRFINLRENLIILMNGKRIGIDEYIEELQQENQQLKERYRIRSEAYNKVLLENASLKDKVDLHKEVIEEVRKTLINSKEYKMANAMNLNAKQSVLVELLQILDKAKENK